VCIKKGAEKVFSKFTCPFANDEKQFTLLPKMFILEVTKQQKIFTWLQEKFAWLQKKFTFLPKSFT
jgi:hypothetical protein